MVCPRCITAVQIIFQDLGLNFSSIKLGEVILNQPITKGEQTALSKRLIKSGFEFLEDKNSTIISKIKSLVISQIHYPKESLKINYSSFLSTELNQEYSVLSKLFSSVEGITIEKFIVSQRIEKVRELLVYNQLSLKEIAYQLNYSSVAHLSNQFKKETGMTPTLFKSLNQKSRKSLDSL
jgi:AraC family transcriptional regulator